MKFMLLICTLAVCSAQQTWLVDPDTPDDTSFLPTNRMTRSLPSQKQVSIGGISYLVDSDVADEIATLPQQEKLLRVQRLLRLQRRASMGPPSWGQKEEKEVSINGVSYLVDSDVADEIATLPQQEKLLRIQRLLRLQRSGSMGSPSWGQKEVSINGVSYLVDSDVADEIATLPQQEKLLRVQRLLRLQRSGSMDSPSWGQKEVSINGVSYLVDSDVADEIATLPQQEKLLRVQRLLRLQRSGNVGSSWNNLTPRLIRSGNLPDKVYNQQFTEQRIIRKPISKTITVLPSEITKVTRNIKTHLPMVHKRIRKHWTEENVNNQKIIHHYVEPVKEEFLGTRTGRSGQFQTQHRFHQNRKFRAETATGDEDLAGEFFWKVLPNESCTCEEQGKMVRPKAICCSTDGTQVDDSMCADIPFPDDLMCDSCN